MKPRHLILAAGVLAAGWLALFADKTPSGGALGTVTGRPTSTKQVPAANVNPAITIDSARHPAVTNVGVTFEPEIVILALRERTDLLGGNKTVKPDDAPFNSQSWVSPAPPPPPPAPVAPPPPPMAPALPFTYLGKKMADASWEIYLGQGDQIHIAHEKSVINDQYRVETIRPPTMTLMYLPLNQLQTLNIGGAD